MATIDNIIETSGHFYSVKKVDSPSTLRGSWGEPDQTNIDTNYYTPKYVVDVLGGAVSETYKRLLESTNYRHSPELSALS